MITEHPPFPTTPPPYILELTQKHPELIKKLFEEAIAGVSLPDHMLFLKTLRCAAEKATFQTFDDSKDDSKTKRPGLIKIIHGAAPENLQRLKELNDQGAGIFLMVNEGDLKGRKTENVIRVRALFADLDGVPVEPVLNAKLKPHMVIESSPCRYHAYWLVHDCPLDQFKRLQKALVAKFDSDPKVCDLPHVMRVPGFFHKKAEPFLSRIVQTVEIPPYSTKRIIDCLGLSLSNDCVQKVHKEHVGEIVQALEHIDPDPYDIWILAGMALKAGFQDEGLSIWLEWGAKSAKYEEAIARAKWESFNREEGDKVTIASIFKLAKDNGFVRQNKFAAQTVDWPEPLSLPDSLPPVKAIDSEMIPLPLRGWLMDIADRMQIPPDFSVAAAIVALGSIIGRSCGIHPKRHDDWLVVPNLWGAVVGRPSLMKTPAISEAQRHLVRLETEAREEYQAAARTFELEKEVAKLTKSAIGEEIKKAVKKGKGIDDARERLAALQAYEPIRRRFHTQDGTVEKIGELLNENPRGLLVNRDELIGWFRTLDKDGRENDRSFYLEAWNGNRGYTYDRIGRGTMDIQATCLSIFGAITPGPLSNYVYQANRGGNGDDGLLQRFQVIVWPDAPAEWKNVDRFPDTSAKNRAWEVFKALSGEIPGAVMQEGGDIPALRFSPAAQDVFDTWRDALEKRLRSDHGLPPSLESHLTKYRSLMPSLCLIFHLVRVVDGTEQPGAVSEHSTVLAVRWCEYLESHAGRIYGAAVIPGMEAAREIIKHIRRRAIKDGASIRDLWRPQWSRLTTSEEVKAGLLVLENYDWLTIEKRETGGRPSEIIRLNPRIKT